MTVPPVEVPFLDLRAMHAELQSDLDAAALRVLRSDRVLLGEELDRFEGAWATTVGAAHGVGVGSGLDALVLALRALGVGPGDEVVVPAHTFVATWLAVLHTGATPVPVDSRPGSVEWDVAAVAAAIGPRTRVLLPVHLYGQPVDLQPVLDLAAGHGLAVVDDAAQAHGASWGGRPVGGLTTMTAWSFYPGKNLGALGDGGAVTTADPALAARVRSLRNYGSTTKYVNDQIGWNSRLDELQAAFLSVKLAHLADHNARRARLAARYERALVDTDLVLPRPAEGTVPAWHLYVVRTGERDALIEHLTARGIQTGIHYPVPCHRQPAFAAMPLAHLALPQADALARDVLSLPLGPHLSDADQDRVVAAIEEFRP